MALPAKLDFEAQKEDTEVSSFGLLCRLAIYLRCKCDIFSLTLKCDITELRSVAI
jgi:hypothetical protein